MLLTLTTMDFTILPHLDQGDSTVSCRRALDRENGHDNGDIETRRDDENDLLIILRSNGVKFSALGACSGGGLAADPHFHNPGDGAVNRGVGTTVEQGPVYCSIVPVHSWAPAEEDTLI